MTPKIYRSERGGLTISRNGDTIQIRQVCRDGKTRIIAMTWEELLRAVKVLTDEGGSNESPA